MKFTDLFGKATSRWIKYSEYDAVQAENGDWASCQEELF